MRLRTLALAAAVSVALLSCGAGAASAAPSSLPDGDTLFAIACPHYSSDDSQLPNMQLIQLDAATAAGTLVGSGTPALTRADCGGQGAWNPVTSTAYALGQDFSDQTDAVLVTIDPVTGLSTYVGDFAVGGDPVLVYAIAISPTGDAYAVGDTQTAEGFYKLDLGSGDLTLVSSMTSDNYSLAFDPTSGILYTLSDNGDVITVDTTTGAEAVVGNVGIFDAYSLAIDSSGTFWFPADRRVPGAFESDLYSTKFADLAAVALVGTISVDGTNPYTEALLLTYSLPAVAPQPQLAATGSTIDGRVVGGALLLLLAGAAIIGVRARRA